MEKRIHARTRCTCVYPNEICYPQQTPVKWNRISLPLRENLQECRLRTVAHRFHSLDLTTTHAYKHTHTQTHTFVHTSSQTTDRWKFPFVLFLSKEHFFISSHSWKRDCTWYLFTVFYRLAFLLTSSLLVAILFTNFISGLIGFLLQQNSNQNLNGFRRKVQYDALITVVQTHIGRFSGNRYEMYV